MPRSQASVKGSNFAPQMIFHLTEKQDKEGLTGDEEKILKLLQEKPKNAAQQRRKDRRVARLENHARAAIDRSPMDGWIDWSSFDWAKLLETILKVLVAILPLILAL